MEGTTSTSNEGSKKRNLDNYEKLNTKKVDKKTIMKELTAIDPNFNLNCIAYDVRDTIKIEQGGSPISVSSADTLEFDWEAFPKYSIKWVELNDITSEKAPAIRKKRKEAKKKRDAEVARSIKSNIEDENNISKTDTDLDNDNR